MSATSAAFGMRPAYHPSGLDRAQALANGIVSGYATTIYKGSPVKIDVATGAIVIAALGTDAIVGCFAGVEFTDTTGRRRVSNFWPANTSATEIVAYFYTDPAIVYEIQTNGTLAQTSIGQEYDLASTTAPATVTTGLSACMMSTTAASANGSAQMRVIDIAPYPDNAWGDAYVIVRAQIAEHQFGSIYSGGRLYPATIL